MRDHTSEPTRKHIPVSQPLTCTKCGLPGGTLVKVDDHYEHQNKVKCGLMQSVKIARKEVS